MSRYIDADEARDNSADPYVRIYLDSQPTADVAPVRHAHWIPVYSRMYACGDKEGEMVQTEWKCSACGREEEDRWQICRCGAKMDEEKGKKPMYERYKVMEEYIRNHKIIDTADLAKILMDENFFPAIVRDAIEKCPALDLFGDEYDLKDKTKTPTWGDDPYILEEEK